MELSAEEARVLGCLIEKQQTTPEYYPLTLNALLTACNQSSNRNPTVSYGQQQASMAIDGLRTEHRLARVVFAGSGSRVDRYKHVIDERLGLSPAEIAVLGILLLRGAQTVGEIKGRTERMYEFASLDQVERVIDRLADPRIAPDLDEYPDERDSGMLTTARRTETAIEPATEGYLRPWDGPLVMRVPRQPGQKEGRAMHTLNGPIDFAALAERSVTGASTNGSAGPGGSGVRNDRMAVLESELTALREQLGDLRTEFETFRQQF